MVANRTRFNTDKDVIVESFRRGRAWVGQIEPEFTELLNLDLTAVEKMDGSEPDAKLLIRSLQLSDINYDPIVAAFHQGRGPDYDGEVGPATMALVHLNRCPLPDIAPPENAAFDTGDEELNKVIESMIRHRSAEAQGSGSWPASGCDPERKGTHSMRIRINMSGAPAKVEAYIKEALDHCIKCSAEMGMAKRYIIDNPSADAELTKTFTRLMGGTIGINYFPTGGCNRITGVLSNNYAPDMRLWANLEEHETGHGYGLNHTRGHIMNPSIVLVWPLTWKGGPSEATMRRFFGGEPVVPTRLFGTPTVPPPGGPVDPLPTGDKEVGRFSDRGNTYKVMLVGGGVPGVPPFQL